MDTKKQLTLAWIVAGILAVLLIASLFFLWHPKAAGSITATRDQIRQDCLSTEVSMRDKCAQDLQDLSDLLAQFSDELKKSRTATSTAQ